MEKPGIPGFAGSGYLTHTFAFGLPRYIPGYFVLPYWHISWHGTKLDNHTFPLYFYRPLYVGDKMTK